MPATPFIFTTQESFPSLDYQWLTDDRELIGSGGSMTEISPGAWEAPAEGSQYDGSHYLLLITDSSGDTVAFLSVSLGADGYGTTIGWIDYNDTTGAVSLAADTWTVIPNNGAGAFSNDNYPPRAVSELIDVSTGAIDPTNLSLGDVMFIRNDFTVNPTINNTALDFRYTLGSGAGAYTLEQQLGRLDRGAGVDYRFSLRVDEIYMGDANTRDNPIGLEVRCSGEATLTNAGSVITVGKR